MYLTCKVCNTLFYYDETSPAKTIKCPVCNTMYDKESLEQLEGYEVTFTPFFDVNEEEES